MSFSSAAEAVNEVAKALNKIEKEGFEIEKLLKKFQSIKEQYQYRYWQENDSIDASFYAGILTAYENVCTELERSIHNIKLN